MESVGVAPMSVRELIVELSEVEDALRRTRRPLTACGPGASDDTEVTALVHREQLIVRELRRRARAHQLGWRPGRSRQPL